MMLSSPNSLGGFAIKRAKGFTAFYAKSMVQKICRTKKANLLKHLGFDFMQMQLKDMRM